MKRIIKISFAVLAFSILFIQNTNAQYATRKISKSQQAYIDSLKTIEYDYIFPIWGQEVYKQGFDIPYPAGIMANYIWMDQSLVFENFELGLKTDNVDAPLQPVDFIKFGDNRNVSDAYNVRPDLWILPFLNISGIFGVGTSTTEVLLTEPVEFKSVVTQSLKTTGFGVMGAFGLGPLWMSVDGNWTWVKPELLEDPVLTKILGVRLGKTFTFKKKPERIIAFWAGGMRIKMNSYTQGSVIMKDAIPQETWDRVDEIVENYNIWYDGLGPIMKEKVDNSAFPAFIDALDNADGSAEISYGMDKKPKQEWNVIIGAQFQVNKNWMLRTEGGIIGDRKSFLVSGNYRFKI